MACTIRPPKIRKREFGSMKSVLVTSCVAGHTRKRKWQHPPVSTLVNDPKYDAPRCLEPAK
jgi:hypothetical protein